MWNSASFYFNLFSENWPYFKKYIYFLFDLQENPKSKYIYVSPELHSCKILWYIKLICYDGIKTVKKECLFLEL